MEAGVGVSVLGLVLVLPLWTLVLLRSAFFSLVLVCSGGVAVIDGGRVGVRALAVGGGEWGCR